MSSKITEEEARKNLQETVRQVKSKMRITKVVATRAVKTKRGDFFAGMSAAWDSVQDDAGGCADVDISVDTEDSAASGMTLEESRVSHILLSMEASIAAWRAALTDGAISKAAFDDKVRTIKHNTVQHLSELVEKVTSDSEEEAA